MRYEDIVTLAQDREQWRIMTAHLIEEDGTDDQESSKKEVECNISNDLYTRSFRNIQVGRTL